MLLAQAKRTLNLAFPIILGEVAQMSLGIIDSAMVGAVSYKQLAAAALVMSVINIPYVFGIGITISVSQMVSMAHGRRDGKLVSHYLFNGFWLCAISAVIISLAIELSKNILFHLGQEKREKQFFNLQQVRRPIPYTTRASSFPIYPAPAILHCILKMGSSQIISACFIFSLKDVFLERRFFFRMQILLQHGMKCSRVYSCFHRLIYIFSFFLTPTFKEE